MNWLRSHGILVLFIALSVGLAWLAYDLLFSDPEHKQGLIIEKIYVPPKTAYYSTPYGGVKPGKYFVTVEKVEQWIAIVRMENGDTVVVHCHPDHYRVKDIGEQIHFKKYEGQHFHIKYFAHNEEED